MKKTNNINKFGFTNKVLSLGLILITLSIMSFKPALSKLVSRDVHVNFFSHTSLEDITADNYKVVCTLDPESGEMVFSVPMQSFEFELALMQKHFNSKDFLDTKKYPKAKFVGKITNLSSVNFSKNGTYNATTTGELTIKDVTKTITEKGTILVENGKITVSTKMKLNLADYGLTFKKGKPSTNLAKEIDVTIKAIFNP